MITNEQGMTDQEVAMSCPWVDPERSFPAPGDVGLGKTSEAGLIRVQG